MMQGLIFSFLTVVLWSVVILLFRYASGTVDAHPIVFACTSLFGASGVLILIAGPGRGGLATLRSPHTWMYGLFQVFLACSEITVTRYVSATEASLLLRFSIILSLVASFLFLKRRIYALDMLGGALLCGAFAYLIAHQPSVSVAVPLTLAVIAAGLFQTGRTLVTELHPEAMRASGVRERCRVVGYVLFVTSVLSLLVFAGIGGLKSVGGSDLPAVFGVFPDLGDFLRRDAFLVGVLTGSVIWSAAMYFYFHSVTLVKTETFLMMTAFMPLITPVLESLAHRVGVFAPATFTGSAGLLLAMLAVVSGALLMIVARHRAGRLR